MASSIASDEVETTGVKHTVASVAVIPEIADIAAESQYYRPYNNYRPSYYNTGYNNRRPFYPARPISYTNNYQQQRPVYNNNRPTYTNNNRPAASSTRPNYASPQPAASSNSHLPGSCGVTNGVYERWGVCWNYQTQTIEVDKSKMTPYSFGQFYDYLYVTEQDIPLNAWVRNMCRVATQMLNNRVVMCAPEEHCFSEQGSSYNEKCYDEICVCLIDERFKPSKNEMIQNMSMFFPAWMMPYATAGLM